MPNLKGITPNRDYALTIEKLHKTNYNRFKEHSKIPVNFSDGYLCKL